MLYVLHTHLGERSSEIESCFEKDLHRPLQETSKGYREIKSEDERRG